jgi:nicotinic acid phosphoribosyltransferase
MNALLTDLYGLTMADGYFESGKAAQLATSELSVRRLPANRKQVVDDLTGLHFTDSRPRVVGLLADAALQAGAGRRL